MKTRLIVPSLILALTMIGAMGLPRYLAGQGPAVAEPPPPRVESPGPPPSREAVWISGHWAWSGDEFRWVEGRWETPPAGHVYVPGRWRKTSAGWVWQPGGWRR